MADRVGTDAKGSSSLRGEEGLTKKKSSVSITVFLCSMSVYMEARRLSHI